MMMIEMLVMWRMRLGTDGDSAEEALLVNNNG